MTQKPELLRQPLFSYTSRTMILKLFTFVVLLLFSISCSSSKQTADEESGDNGVYIFDAVPIDDTPTNEFEQKEIQRNYVIQIGAFSSKENADKFAEESKTLLGEDVKVDYNERISMYVVVLSRIFESRSSALNQRDKLWKYNQFSDAWLKEVK